MKGLFFLLLLISLQAASQETFEGIITFKMTTKVKDIVKDSSLRNYYQNMHGDSMKVYYRKDGSLSYNVYGKAEWGSEWRIYDRTTNTFFLKWKGYDTIYYYNCGEFEFELQSVEAGPHAIVNGGPCKSVKVVSYDAKNNETYSITYYYSGEQKIPSHKYQGFKYGYLEKAFAISGSQFLREDAEFSTMLLTLEAIRVESGAVGDVMFEIPADLPRIDITPKKD